MRSLERLAAILVPALLAVLVVFAWTNANAAGDERVRHRELDGKGATRLALDDIEAVHRRVRASLAKSISTTVTATSDVGDHGHHAGLKACFSRRQRSVTVAASLPEVIRGRSVYFVTAPSGRDVPAILRGSLSEDGLILVIEAKSLADVAALSRAVDRPVALGSAELARALGVQCCDAKVAVSADGRTVAIEEGRP